MDEFKKLKIKRETIRRLTKNLFQKIDEELYKEDSIELEFCLEKLADKEESLMELNLKVEFFCSDKDVFDNEIGCSEEWNESIIEYRTKINQKLKILQSYNDATWFFPIVTPPLNRYYNHEVEHQSIDSPFQENSQSWTTQIQEIEFMEEGSANSVVSLAKQAIVKEELDEQTNFSFPTIHGVIKKEKQIPVKRRKTRCKDCNITVTQFVKHRSLVHNDPKPFKCNLCPFASNIPSVLKLHNAVHTGEKSLQCKFCEMKFRFLSNLSRHSKTHMRKTPYKCNLCFKAFNRKDSLLNHMKKTHDEMKLPVKNAVESGQSLTVKKRLNKKNKRPNKKYNPKNTLKKNREAFKSNMTQVSENVLDCLDKYSGTKNSLINVKKIKLNGKLKASTATTEVQISDGFKTGSNDKSSKIFLPCQDCEDRFDSAPEYLDHCVKIHSTNKPFKCPICRYSSTLKSLFLCHLKRHLKKERPYQCKYCEKRFIYRSNVVNHEKIHTTNGALHAKEIKHQCQVCSEYFDNNEALANHSHVHKGGKPFQCEVCLKHFTHQGAMTNHSRVHKGAVTNHSLVRKGTVTNHSLVHKGTVTNNSLVHKGTVTNRSLVHKGTVTNDSLVHKGTVTTDSLVHKGTVTTDSLVHKGTVTTDSLVHKGTVTTDSLVHKGTVTNDPLVHKGAVTNDSLVHKGAVTNDSLVQKDGKPFQCKVCLKHFSHQGAITNHSRVHNGAMTNRSPVHKEAMTNRSRAHKGAMTNHTRANKGSITNHTRANKGSITNHSRVHMGAITNHSRIHKGGNPLQCKVCLKQFAHRGAMTNHSRVHMIFKRNVPLSKSVSGKLKSVHTRIKWGNQGTNKVLQSAKSSATATEDKVTEKPENKPRRGKYLQCQYCKKRFYHALDYINHCVKIHGTSKKFECPVCQYATKLKWNFSRHLKQHAFEKRFICKVCQKSFLQLSHLKDHKHVHSGERPYKCRYCEKQYIYQPNRTRHENKHEIAIARTIGNNVFNSKSKWKSIQENSNSASTIIEHDTQNVPNHIEFGEEESNILGEDTEDVKYNIPRFY